MPAYFSDASFKFLDDLARHNERAWFHDNKARYEAHVREPFRKLLVDLQPALHEVSPRYRADPKNVGGSLFRIHRDTRFSRNKAPYKTWQGVRLFHERRRQVHAPSWYIHLQPGNCFAAAGTWHPESDDLRRIRHFILDNPASWARITQDKAFRRRYALDESEMLIRMPRGFPPGFEHADDLRRKNFVAFRNIDDTTMTGPRLRSVLERDLVGLAPLVDYLCAALDLDF